MREHADEFEERRRTWVRVQLEGLEHLAGQSLAGMQEAIGKLNGVIFSEHSGAAAQRRRTPAFALARQLPTLFERADDRAKQELLSIVMQARLLDGKRLALEWRQPLDRVALAATWERQAEERGEASIVRMNTWLRKFDELETLVALLGASPSERSEVGRLVILGKQRV